MANANQSKMLSIIIPTLNEAKRLPLLLADLRLYPNDFEIIVVDGGSTDSTRLVAKLGGAKVLNCFEDSVCKEITRRVNITNRSILCIIHNYFIGKNTSLPP